VFPRKSGRGPFAGVVLAEGRLDDDGFGRRGRARARAEPRTARKAVGPGFFARETPVTKNVSPWASPSRARNALQPGGPRGAPDRKTFSQRMRDAEVIEAREGAAAGARARLDALTGASPRFAAPLRLGIARRSRLSSLLPSPKGDGGGTGSEGDSASVSGSDSKSRSGSASTGTRTRSAGASSSGCFFRERRDDGEFGFSSLGAAYPRRGDHARSLEKRGGLDDANVSMQTASLGSVGGFGWSPGRFRVRRGHPARGWAEPSLFFSGRLHF